MCIMTISSEGELELVGLMRLRKQLFLRSALCNHRSRELYGSGRGGALTHFVFVNGGRHLFIDAGTRVPLLDAKGLSFTQNVFICICYCLQYIWIWGSILRYNGLLCLENTCFASSRHTAFCGSVWTASPPYLDSDKLNQECSYNCNLQKRKKYLGSVGNKQSHQNRQWCFC